MSVIESHPLEPFYPSNAILLMLGSFPPPRNRWKMDFYYPNLQNDMWRIFGLVFFQNKDHFLAKDQKSFQEKLILDFLKEKGIALSDTARKVIRLKENASDQFLEIVEKIDFEKVLAELPLCRVIVATGEKAAETLLSILAPERKIPSPGAYVEISFAGRNLTVWRMPSSSRAYPKPIGAKAEAYRQMFAQSGLI